jgi:hypothetical protein
MKKNETEFKLEVVKSLLAGENGAKLLARQWPQRTLGSGLAKSYFCASNMALQDHYA